MPTHTHAECLDICHYHAATINPVADRASNLPTRKSISVSTGKEVYVDRSGTLGSGAVDIHTVTEAARTFSPGVLYGSKGHGFFRLFMHLCVSLFIFF